MNFTYLLNTLSIPLFTITSILYISLTFYISYFVIHEYISPSLTEIFKKLPIETSINNLLHLNISNGIPEIITYIILSESSNNVNSINNIILISLGSFIFMLTVGMGLIILYSKQKTFLEFTTFYNNVLFMMVAYSIFIYLFLIESVTFLIGAIMTFSYLIFVIISFYVSKMRSSSESEEELIILVNEEQKTIFKLMYSTFKYAMRIVLDFFLISQKDDNFIFDKYVYGLTSGIIMPSLFYYTFVNNITLSGCIITLSISLLMSTLLAYSIRKDIALSFISIYTFISGTYIIYLLYIEILSFLHFLSSENIVPLDFTYAILLPVINNLHNLINAIFKSKKGKFQLAALSCMTTAIYNTFISLGITIMLITYKNDFKMILIALISPLTSVLVAFIPLIMVIMAMNYEIRNKKLETEFAYVMLFVYAFYVYFCGLEYANSEGLY